MLENGSTILQSEWLQRPSGDVRSAGQMLDLPYYQHEHVYFNGTTRDLLRRELPFVALSSTELKGDLPVP